jgi:hypothetical protein
MEKAAIFENYPSGTIWRSNAVSLGIYASGLYLMLKAGWIYSLAFLMFVLGSNTG